MIGGNLGAAVQMLKVMNQQGGGQSWDRYWASQPEVLFFGLYSDISGGQMPNKVPGSSDYLTVAGVAGSETYQCPNTAPYIAADTDYIWFKTDGSQRTATTAELIGYDLQRTPVKYEDDSPNEIAAIIILNSAVTGTKRNNLFRDMWLPVLWDNSFNIYGHVKDNRGATQQLWTPESVYPAILNDGNTIAFFDFDDLTTITKDGSDKVSRWNDKLLSGRDLLQGVSGAQPLYVDGVGIRLNGTSNFMQTAPFTFNKPELIYIVWRALSYTNSDSIFDGNAGNTMRYAQGGSEGWHIMYAGTILSVNNISINNWAITRCLFNGASSKSWVNAGLSIDGNSGTNNAGGFTLGASGGGGLRWSNIEVKDIILRKIVDTDENMNTIINYLNTKYSIY